MALLAVDSAPQDPFYAHSLYVGDDPVGVVTSGGYGHRTGLNLALAYLRDPDAVFAADRGEGKPLEMRILNQRYPAKILTAIPFDPRNERLKA